MRQNETTFAGRCNSHCTFCLFVGLPRTFLQSEEQNNSYGKDKAPFRNKYDLENSHRHKHKHLHTICVKFENQRDILRSLHIKTNIQARTSANRLKLNLFTSRSTSLEIIPSV
ncbi:hypothetical protein ILYODFUR_004371 [Ilyodon furcidens]|uniref:Uncharacterized protein n=1 Tax=Ilyodon furcidens TaxID=33524 RepID=A0ABV0UP04_9TELE